MAGIEQLVPSVQYRVASIRRDEDLTDQGKDLEEILERWPIES